MLPVAVSDMMSYTHNTTTNSEPEKKVASLEKTLTEKDAKIAYYVMKGGTDMIIIFNAAVRKLIA